MICKDPEGFFYLEIWNPQCQVEFSDALLQVKGESYNQISLIN